MITLVASLEDTVLTEKTFFSADEAAGQTTLSSENSQGFAANDYVILGYKGSETAEVRQLSSGATDTTLVVAATSFAHQKGEPITKILFNKRKFYRSTSKTGSYTHLSSEGSPVAIEVDRPDGTYFEDSTGSTSNWYKATYYNSYTATETDIEDATPTAAGNAEFYTSIYKIKKEAGFVNNDSIESENVARHRDAAQSQVDGSLAIRYSVPLSPVPKLITHITTLLAAGLLLAEEYGVEADVEVSKTGERKIQRAEDLLAKLVAGDILLTDDTGVIVDSRSTMRVSGSNSYDSGTADKGEMFNLVDENFKFTDPAEPLSSSDRISTDSQRIGTQWSSQR